MLRPDVDRFSCHNLKNMDLFSKSDPFVVIDVDLDHDGNWTEIARTEIIDDDLNPTWKTVHRMEYFPLKPTKMRFRVFDCDNRSSSDLAKHDLEGMVHTTLKAIVGKTAVENTHGIVLPLHDESNDPVRPVAKTLRDNVPQRK